ncbi:MAG: hypothetical protein H0T99_05085 [Geodermatophilaceae bacterium]|nr:hypothetical protein [Geodermatophilaceae bacterium]MDQ3476895.1 hypothetical protein [Actinomycetota bacterium]
MDTKLAGLPFDFGGAASASGEVACLDDDGLSAAEEEHPDDEPACTKGTLAAPPSAEGK